MIGEETNAEMVPSNGNSAEVMTTNQVDRRFYGIHPKRARSLKRTPDRLKEQPEFGVFAAKMVVDTADPARVRLLQFREPPAAIRTRPRRLRGRVRSFAHRSSQYR
jgi:hypothetical protein